VVSVELGSEFELVVRDAETGKELRRAALGPSDYDTTGLVLRHGKAWIASVDGTIRIVDLERVTETERLHLGSAATAIAVDDEFVVTGTETGVLCLRRLSDLALLQCTRAHVGRISSVDLRGEHLISGAWSGEATLWSVPDLKRQWSLDGRGSVNDVAISPSASSIALARSKSPPVRTPAIERAERKSGQSSAKGAVVEVISIDRTRSSEFRGHFGAVTAVAWLGDGALVSAGWDRRVALWDTARGRLLDWYTGFEHLVHDVASRPGGTGIAVAAWAIGPKAPASVSLTLIYGE